MYENSLTANKWKYSAMTEGGAYTLAKTMQNRFGCKILSTPKKNKKDMWEFTFTNPLLKKEK